MVRFTDARRERFVALVAGGAGLEEAAASVGISRRSVMDWLARGRVQEGTPAAEFAAAFEAARAGGADVSADRLTEDDLVALMEAQARRGNVPAIRLLLERATVERSRAENAARRAELEAAWDDEDDDEDLDAMAALDRLAARRRRVLDGGEDD